MRETFHVYCVTATGGRYRFTSMARDAADARAAAEANGHTVRMVRRPPHRYAKGPTRQGS